GCRAGNAGADRGASDRVRQHPDRLPLAVSLAGRDRRRSRGGGADEDPQARLERPALATPRAPPLRDAGVRGGPGRRGGAAVPGLARGGARAGEPGHRERDVSAPRLESEATRLVLGIETSCDAISVVGVNHAEAHLHAAALERGPSPEPAVALVVSGGHSELVEVSGFRRYRWLGCTRDDAAGEAYDKVAKLLGLGFPGGPLIDALAERGRPDAFAFPRPMLGSRDLD